MTRNHSVTINVSEITTVEVRCTNCPSFTAYALGYRVPDFLSCPGCGTVLLENGPVATAIFKLHAALTEWNRISHKPLNLTFTVDLPDEPQ
jgi:hypothetical protein